MLDWQTRRVAARGRLGHVDFRFTRSHTPGLVFAQLVITIGAFSACVRKAFSQSDRVSGFSPGLVRQSGRQFQL